LLNTCEHCCTRVEDLTVKLGSNVILSRVNLHVNCGQVVGVVGPNGAGKTTLLRTLMGEMPYQGRISFRVGGNPSQTPKIGYVPQKLHLEKGAPVSVADLVASAVTRRPVWAGIDGSTAGRVKEVLSLFSAEHLVKRKVGDLSGGELQRVLLAIAMTPAPDLLLLDEPASGVDAKGLALFYRIVRGLRQTHDISVVLVTHDLAGIYSYVDRMVLLNRGVIAEGTPREVLADGKLVEVFGAALWNISCLPDIVKDKGKGGDNAD